MMRKISSENFAFFYKGGMSYATFKTIFPQSIYAKQKDRESNQMTSTLINDGCTVFNCLREC